MTGMPPPMKRTLKLNVLPQAWHDGGRCVWKGFGIRGECTGWSCREFTGTEARCALDLVALNPGGMTHKQVGAALGIGARHVRKDEARALAILSAAGIEWSREAERFDPLSGIADNFAADVAEVTVELRRRGALRGRNRLRRR